MTVKWYEAVGPPSWHSPGTLYRAEGLGRVEIWRDGAWYPADRDRFLNRLRDGDPTFDEITEREAGNLTGGNHRAPSAPIEDAPPRKNRAGGIHLRITGARLCSEIQDPRPDR
jgi:hypothetical protein